MISTFSRRRGSSACAAVVYCFLLAACSGGDGPVAPTPQEGATPIQLVFEAFPYEAIGPNRIAFNRRDKSGAGIVTLDGIAGTVKATHAAYGQDLAVTIAGSRIATTRAIYPPDGVRYSDVYLRDLNSTGGGPIGGPGGDRSSPAWAPNGATVVFTESPEYSSVRYTRIVSTSYAMTDRQVLWESDGKVVCEGATKPRLNGVGDLLFLYFLPEPSHTGCGAAAIATKKPGAPFKMVYVPVHPFALMTAVWSPSGEEIAFMEQGAASGEFVETRLNLMAADGSNLRTIVVPGVSRLGLRPSLCWAGDGSRIFFTAPEPGWTSHVYVVRTDGTGLAQITSAPGVEDESIACT